MAHEAMKNMFKQIPTMKSKPLSHNKDHQLLLTYIGCACYLTHLAAWYYFIVNHKTQVFLPVRRNLFVVCNLTDVRYSVSVNGVKRVVIDLALTLKFCVSGVTHECMSSVFEVFFLFWFLVMSLLSSWDEMGVRVELLSDYVWAAENDKTGFLSVEVDIFESIIFSQNKHFGRPLST